jgi:hypothetical protein
MPTTQELITDFMQKLLVYDAVYTIKTFPAFRKKLLPPIRELITDFMQKLLVHDAVYYIKTLPMFRMNLLHLSSDYRLVHWQSTFGNYPIYLWLYSLSGNWHLYQFLNL